MRRLSSLPVYAMFAAVLACSGAEPSAPTPQTDASKGSTGTNIDPAPPSGESVPLSPNPDAKVIETYALETVAGQGLPQSYSGGGIVWTVTGGQYDLMSDGTYYFYYIGVPWENGSRSRPAGHYSRIDPATILFYITGPVGSFYEERGRLFSTGTLSGDTMTVRYEDPVDFDVEVYRRR
jgi:hypothetical protein